MPSFPQFYDAGDAAQITVAISAAADHGDSVAAVQYNLWNDKGGTLSASASINPRLRVEVFDGADWVSSGFPAVDEQWVQVAVIGIDNTGDSTMGAQTTGYVPIGAGHDLILGDIPKNCARHLSVQIVLPAGGSTASYELRLVLIDEDTMVPIPFRLGTVSGAGIIPDRLDVSARRLRRGRMITAAGSAVVTVTKGAFVYDGTVANVLSGTKTLNQNDGASSALTAGQSYIAVLSQKSDSTVTVTKGNRASFPATPSTPGGEIYLGKVTVAYQGGGTSVINSGNVDLAGVHYGEAVVAAGAGLNVTIGAGFALTASDTQPFSGSVSTIGVADSATNYIWWRTDGTLSSTTTTTPPATGALLLASAVTSGGVVTSVQDLRPWVDRAVFELPIRLQKVGAFSATAVDFDWDTAPFDYVIDRVRLEIGKKGVSASGSFKVDVLTRPPGTDLGTSGTTIYTSSGSDDQRPTIAYNASTLYAESFDFEVVNGAKGDRISASLVAVPGTITGNPEDVKVSIWLRRR